MSPPPNQKPGAYRQKLPSIREEISPGVRRARDTAPGHPAPPPGNQGYIEPEDYRDDDENTGNRSADSLVVEYELSVRKRRELEAQKQKLEEELRAERAKPAVVESDSTEFTIRSKGVHWEKVWRAIPFVLGASGLGLGVRANVVNEKPVQDVAPVSADVVKIDTRVARIEACLAANNEADQRDADFIEKALELAGVQLPRRPDDEAPRVIATEAKPLVNPKPGTRQIWKITSTRPSRPKCPAK